MLIPTWTTSCESRMSPAAWAEPSKKPDGPEFGLDARTVGLNCTTGGSSWSVLGGGQLVWPQKPNLPPKLCFSSDFGHFIGKIHNKKIEDFFKKIFWPLHSNSMDTTAELEKWLHRWGDQISGGPRWPPLKTEKSLDLTNYFSKRAQFTKMIKKY